MKRRIRPSVVLVALFLLAAAEPICAAWSRPKLLGTLEFIRSGMAVAVSGNTVHVVWTLGSEDRPPLDGRIMYNRSTDCGATWSPAVQIASTPQDGGVVSLAATGDDVHLVWDGGGDIRSFQFRVFHAVSRDGGRTWSEQRLISPELRYARGGAVAASGQEVYVAFALGGKGPRRSLNRTRIFVAASSDGGRTWSPRKATSRVRGFLNPFVAVGARSAEGPSRLHLTWGENRGAFEQRVARVWYQVSESRGRSWFPASLVNGDFPGVDFVFPSALVALGAGAHVLWDRSLALGGDVAYNGSVDGAFRQEGLRLGGTLDPDRPGASMGTLAATRTVLHAAWSERSPSLGTGVYSARSRDRGATWTSPKLMSRFGAGYPAIAASPSSPGLCRDTAHLVFLEGTKKAGARGQITYRRWPRAEE